MATRIGFIGIVLEDLSQAPRVNALIGQVSDMVTGRIGVPDHERGLAVIGLLVEGDHVRIGWLTGKLGNLPGVQVKSALTSARAELSTPEDPAQQHQQE